MLVSFMYDLCMIYKRFLKKQRLQSEIVGIFLKCAQLYFA